LRLGLPDGKKDGLLLIDGIVLNFIDGLLLGTDVGLRLGLKEEANDGLPLADGKKLGFADG